mgnify:CR=1 FL=1
MTILWEKKIDISQPKNRPLVILSCAISLDGKLASEEGDTKLSSYEDKVEVHKLRSQVDAIMVGVNTVLKDDPHLTISDKYYKSEKHPIRVIVDSKARTPPNAKCITYRSHVPTIIAVTNLAPREKIEELEKAGAKVLIVNEGNKVDLKKLLRILYEKFEVSKLMVEGGGKIIGSLLKERLIDLVRISITPVILGGIKKAVNLAHDVFWGKIDEAPWIDIFKIELVDYNLVIHGKVVYR